MQSITRSLYHRVGKKNKTWAKSWYSTHGAAVPQHRSSGWCIHECCYYLQPFTERKSNWCEDTVTEPWLDTGPSFAREPWSIHNILWRPTQKKKSSIHWGYSKSTTKLTSTMLCCREFPSSRYTARPIYGRPLHSTVQRSHSPHKPSCWELLLRIP